jgi:hypothetical protein
VVEDGKYRAEEQTTRAPQPPLVLAGGTRTGEDALPELRSCALPAVGPPPDLPKGWQFRFRAALLPRAPSFIG